MRTILLLFALATAAQAQTCTGICKPFESVSASIITTAGQVSISPADTETLRAAHALATDLAAKAQAALIALQKLESKVAASYGADASKPFQIVMEHSTTLSYMPPAPKWVKLGVDGDTVLIPAGTMVRYGAFAGAVAAYPPGSTATLAADTFTQKTFTADTTVILGNATSMAAAGLTDPAFGYPKQLDQMMASTTLAGIVSAQ